jgi:hypothetical protein
MDEVSGLVSVGFDDVHGGSLVDGAAEIVHCACPRDPR